MLRLLQVTDTLVEKGEELFEQGKEIVGDVLGQVPEDLNQIVETAKAEPLLLAILIGVGVLAGIIFFWGIVKQLFKAAIVAGVLSAGAWYWYFNIR